MANQQQDVNLRFTVNGSDIARVRGAFTAMETGIRGVRTAMSALGVGLSLGGMVAFVKNAADAVSQQRALADSVGLTVSEFSALNYAARQNEATQEDLGKALFKVNELLKEGAEAGSKGAQLLDRFGISSSKVRDGTIGTQEALRMIADRFNAMPNGIDKSSMAAELLGDKLGQRLIPFLNLGSKGLDEFAAAGEAAGAVMNDKVATAVAMANDKLAAMWQQLQTQTLVGLAALFDLIESNVGDKAIEKLSEQINGLTQELALLDEQNKHGDVTQNGILGNLLHAGDAARIAAIRNELAALRKERDKLKAEQLERLATPDGKPKPGVTPKPLTGPKKPYQPSDEEIGTGKLIDQHNADVTKAAQAETDALRSIQDELKGVGDEEDKAAERRARLNQLYAEGRISGEEYRAELENMAGALDMVGEAGEALDASGALSVFAEEAARNIQDITASLLAGEEGFKNFGENMVKTLRKIAAELLAQQLLTALFNLAGTNASGVGYGTALFGGKRAGGGPIDPGKFYLVGEQGPELIAPRGAGNVIPAGKFGGGGTEVNVYNQASGATATTERRRGSNGREIVDVVIREIARDIRDGGPTAAAISGVYGVRRTGRGN